jgi:hypothetical protein
MFKKIAKLNQSLKHFKVDLFTKGILRRNFLQKVHERFFLYK